MGVTGLLRLVQSYSESKPVTSFSGQTLGVDAFSWLHRAAICCAEQLVRGEHPTRLIQSIDNRVRVYERHNVSLYFVFDGAPLKMKERIATQRRKLREEAKAGAERSMSGSSASSAFMKKAIDITSDHAAMVMAYLKARGIKFVVAPYEADAQLVYMEKMGYIDAIVSEDSDMLVFGAQRLLTKADAHSGQAVEVNAAKLPPDLACTKRLRALAIISGCDYSPGIAGFGPIKAQKLVEANGGDLEQVLSYMRRIDKCDAEFIEMARNANAAFLFQRVWDPKRCVMTYLNSPEAHLKVDSVDSLRANHALSETLSRPAKVTSASSCNIESSLLADHVIGALLPRPTAHRLAVGHIDPRNFDRALSVQPHISTFVSKLTPYKPVKPHRLGTPLGVSKEVNRRLNITPEGSVSRYFKPALATAKSAYENKENVIPTPTSLSPSSTSSRGVKRSNEHRSPEKAHLLGTHTNEAPAVSSEQTILITPTRPFSAASPQSLLTPTKSHSVPGMTAKETVKRRAFGPTLQTGSALDKVIERQSFGPTLESVPNRDLPVDEKKQIRKPVSGMFSKFIYRG